MMIVTMLAIGATMLVAITIGGLLTLYQARQANDIANSAKAIFASDTGIELGLYRFFKGTEYVLTPLGSGESVTIACYNAVDDPGFARPITCSNPSSTVIRSQGRAGRSTRALQFNVQ